MRSGTARGVELCTSAAAASAPPITLGATVAISGIVSQPALNGTRGVVVLGPDPETGRWAVRCAVDGKSRRLKPANLALAVGRAAFEAELREPARAAADWRADPKAAVVSRLSAAPVEVRAVLDGELMRGKILGTAEHKRIARIVAAWLVGAHAAAHDDPATKRLARLVLGIPTFARNMGFDRELTWDAYQNGLRAHLKRLGAPLGEAFARKGLCAALGGLTLPRHAEVRAALGEDGALRCDILGVVPVPVNWAFDGPAVVRQRQERIFIHMLKMAGMALNDDFHAMMREVLGPHVVAGEGVMAQNADGSWRLTPEKGVARMECKRLTDHGPESGCRPGFNIDVLRVLGVCPTADKLKAALADLGTRFEGCGRVKSGFDADDASDRFHLRTLLGNVLVDFGLTFAQLAARPGVADMWAEHAEQGERGDVSREQWNREAAAARAVLESAELEAQPVRFICEAQLMLADVYEVRKRMHEPYKGLRADDCKMLHADMLGETLKARRVALFQRDGDTVLKRACRDGDVGEVQALLAQGGFREGEIGEAFVVGCVSGGVDAVLPALAAQAPVAHWHEAWERAGRKEAVAEMGEAVVGALVGAVPEAGLDAVVYDRTALQLAAGGGHARAVRVLLEAGAAVDRADSLGQTALWAAAFEGQEAVARLLIGAGAAVDRANKDGRTPLYNAAEKGHDALVAVLLDAGATVDPVEEGGRTPLWRASENGHEAVAEVLLAHNPEVDKSRANGESPLWQASHNGHVAIAKLLLEAGAEVDKAQVTSCCTPLWRASQSGHDAIVRLLLGAGAEVDKAKANGATPLMLAAEYGHGAVVELLLEVGAEVDKPNCNQSTPLGMASINGHFAVIGLLLAAGADASHKDRWWRTPLMWAVAKGHKEAAALLQAART
jgi:ankyrin repeat protein